jgi:hypothetical protein
LSTRCERRSRAKGELEHSERVERALAFRREDADEQERTCVARGSEHRALELRVLRPWRPAQPVAMHDEPARDDLVAHRVATDHRGVPLAQLAAQTAGEQAGGAHDSQHASGREPERDRRALPARLRQREGRAECERRKGPQSRANGAVRGELADRLGRGGPRRAREELRQRAGLREAIEHSRGIERGDAGEEQQQGRREAWQATHARER